MREGGTVLALDAAIRTGWAVGPAEPGAIPLSGSQSFGRPEVSRGQKYINASAWAQDMFKVHRPKAVFIERPHMGSVRRGQSAAATFEMLFGFMATFEAVAVAYGCFDIHRLDAGQWRKFFIHAGNLKGDIAKAQTRAECIRRGWVSPDELDYDKTDALGIWAYGVETIRPGSIALPLAGVRTGDTLTLAELRGRK